MFAVRAAVLAIAVSVLSPPFAPATVTSASTPQGRGFAIFELNSLIVRPVFGLPRSSALTRFTPWKARPKIVLAEADQSLSEETDLGPVLVPHGVSSPVSTAKTTPRQPSFPPLRC
jgi:hypothetical protein